MEAGRGVSIYWPLASGVGAGSGAGGASGAVGAGLSSGCGAAGWKPRFPLVNRSIIMQERWVEMKSARGHEERVGVRGLVGLDERRVRGSGRQNECDIPFAAATSSQPPTTHTPTRERTGHLKGGGYSHESTRSMLSSTTMLRGRWIASVLVRLARRSFASDGCGSSSAPAAAPAAAAPRAPGRPVPPLLRPTQPPSHRRDSKKSNQYASTFVSWSRSPVVRVLIFLPRTRPSSNLARQQRGTTRVGQPSTQSGEKRSR